MENIRQSNPSQTLTSAQRAYLRGLANGARAILQIGKDGIGEAFIEQVDAALEKRELIKLSLLETCSLSVEEAARILCDATGAQSVQMIGRRLVLYRRASKEENRKITLPARGKNR